MKAETSADPDGRWVLKKTPAGWYRVVIEADGYVPRIVGYAQFDEQPLWQSYECGIAPAAAVSGHVTDDAGKPLEGVDVRLSDVVPSGGGRYESPDEYRSKTDADGRFHHDRVPAGNASVWVHKKDYCRPGLGQPIKIPANDVALTMVRSARIQVTVDFAGKHAPKGTSSRSRPKVATPSEHGEAPATSTPATRSCFATCHPGGTSSKVDRIHRVQTRNPIR